jgi:uncharacterized glyoxalase superfamily protein PhnB
MPVKPRPDRYHAVTPYLTVQGVARLLDFVQRAFDAQELERMSRPDGTIGHAEVRIGRSIRRATLNVGSKVCRAVLQTPVNTLRPIRRHNQRL